MCIWVLVIIGVVLLLFGWVVLLVLWEIFEL